MKPRVPFLTAAAALMLAGCQSEGQIVLEEGVGVTALRTPCPAVGIPAYTGDVTLFSPEGARTADAIDLSATITNVRAQCDDSGKTVRSTATFDVFATRMDTREARTVQLPYFSTVVRGGDSVVSKRIGTVTLSFAPGEARAQAQGTAAAYIDRAAATLPEDIRQQITKRRRLGDPDAAIDPMSVPEVRAALDQASFELLVGFQLNEAQLAYNATR